MWRQSWVAGPSSFALRSNLWFSMHCNLCFHVCSVRYGSQASETDKEWKKRDALWRISKGSSYFLGTSQRSRDVPGRAQKVVQKYVHRVTWVRRGDGRMIHSLQNSHDLSLWNGHGSMRPKRPKTLISGIKCLGGACVERPLEWCLTANQPHQDLHCNAAASPAALTSLHLSSHAATQFVTETAPADGLQLEPEPRSDT